MKKENLLFITNLHFSPNGNGGQQRTFFLIKELSQYYDLTVISPYKSKKECSLCDFNANFVLNRGLAIDKLLIRNIFFRGIRKLFLLFFHKKNQINTPFYKFFLKKQILKYNKKIDNIVFDTISTYIPIERKYVKTKILNAHNFEFELNLDGLIKNLKNVNFSETKIKQHLDYLLKIRKIESNIDKFFDEIWVCSKNDKEKFSYFSNFNPNNIYILPNGSDTEKRQKQKFGKDYKKLLFVGTLNYYPNSAGLIWFIQNIFKYLPKDYSLSIIGRSPTKEIIDLSEKFSNINLIGEVDNVSDYYKKLEVAIVPLLHGSGTRLKILEAFSYGKLVISTPKGIEGIHAKENEHYLKFENKDEFFYNFVKKIDDISFFETVRNNARIFVENNFSWKKIIENYIKEKYG